MKVLFLCFQENSDVIGVKYLDALLRSKGHRSSILLISNAKPANFQAAIEHVLQIEPDLLCFSAMSYEFARARDFALELRERFTGRPVVFGGIHATTDPESCLAVSDVVVRGEGEETLLDLLPVLTGAQERPLHDIPGIAFIQDGKVVCTSVRQPPQDLDALPPIEHLPPSLSVVHQGRVQSISDRKICKEYVRYQGTFLSVVSSRGCPFSCRYCCNSALKSLYGHSRVRPRAADLVVDEIVREVKKSGKILYVNFQDDCFMMHRIEWLERFARRYREEVGIPFIVRTTPKHITHEKLKLLKEAGLRWVFMGMQTGSDRINREVYGRNVSAEQFLAAAKLVTALGLSAWYDVILDNPYETEEDHLKTIDLLLRIPRPYQLDLFSLDYFPGTALWDQVREDRIPVAGLGKKSYTQPEPTLINRYIRMSATLPRGLVRHLVAVRRTKTGRALGMLGYLLCLATEPFIYLWLILKSRDFRVGPTLRTIAAFYETAFNKLILRKQG